MTRRIFRSICFAAIAVFLASLVFIMGVLYDYFSTVQRDQMRRQAELIAQGVTNEGIHYFSGLRIYDYRITWISADGTVLYDSQSNAENMENHLEREEIREAFASGYGESSRYSTTLTERLLYSAKRLPDGTVIRLSGSQRAIWVLLLGMIQPILIMFLIVAGISLFLASRLSRKIVDPLNELNLDEPLSNKEYVELSPLLKRISLQQKQLKNQAAELRRKQEEFETATDHMNEGLMLLNEKGIILSINQTASRLLSISKFCIGKDILMLNNAFELQELLNKAQNGEHAQMPMKLNGLEYQLNASPVITDGEVSGIALLIFDVTEKEKAEQMRREFTANVSHELKTPLHSISGYAELLKNDMVKPEDIPKFSGRIYSEAQRMIYLVDDIIKLSHLDEDASDLKWENVDLYEIATDTVHILEAEAYAAKVTLTVNGVSTPMWGIPQLLSSIVFNLCDNAIKYNRENGSVSVEVQNKNDAIILSVSDTGIGIPAEHQDRIFERFYRVDKSHSKEVGGTGLGLSIVKHAAKLHNAAIELHSVTGGGTTVIVTFPHNYYSQLSSVNSNSSHPLYMNFTRIR